MWRDLEGGGRVKVEETEPSMLRPYFFTLRMVCRLAEAFFFDRN